MELPYNGNVCKAHICMTPERKYERVYRLFLLYYYRKLGKNEMNLAQHRKVGVLENLSQEIV